MARPYHASDIWARPEWAMIGVHWPHPPEQPCMLIASNYWTEGEIQVWWHHREAWLDDPRDVFLLPGDPPSAEASLRTDNATRMIFIQAATWRECIEVLFSKWQPETSQREITGRGELPPGGCVQ